ncbi:MAG: thiamine biosynthesis protein ThiS [Rickettsiales bacterium]|nr:thiamine biosynthesis protein ThiS [Rickettsiales bacterium]|tara:strand:- start:275 stop:484 length:210 start_codon:yes stop_codon:yes gene_type:complete
MVKINIYINGDKKLVNINCSLNDILENFKIDRKKIAVEINQKVISKSLYNSTVIKADDRIEIVQFIGGG